MAKAPRPTTRQPSPWDALSREVLLRFARDARAVVQHHQQLLAEGYLGTDAARIARYRSACVVAIRWARRSATYFRRSAAKSRSGPAEQRAALRATLDALVALAQQSEQRELQTFATLVTGDTHAFDGKRLAGRYLRQAIADLPLANGAAPPLALGTPAEVQDNLLRRVGLYDAGVSSTVLVTGLRGGDPMLQAPLAITSVLAIPLCTLRRPEFSSVHAYRQTAFVVENPTAIAAIAERLRIEHIPPDRWPTVVCTSGSPELAVQQLLVMLHRSGAQLYYSGDFDVRGLSTARFVRRLCPGTKLWWMSAQAYNWARAWRPGVLLDLDKLGKLRDDFPALVDEMTEREFAGFQEAIVGHLLREVIDFANGEDVSAYALRGNEPPVAPPVRDTHVPRALRRRESTRGGD